MIKIFLAEDDEAIVNSLKDYLSGEGYSVSSASGQSKAVEMIRSGDYDLLLLDVSLSDGNGFNIFRETKDLRIPAVFLTASDDEGSVVKGLDMGAEDYIAKPFRPRELLSRIKNVLRRCSGNEKIVSVGDLVIDTERCTVSKNGEELTLSALEYRLLTVFINNRGILLSRNRLLEDIWDIAGDFVNDNTLTVYIKRLRKKIEDDPQEPQIIKTVRGLGYRMD